MLNEWNQPDEDFGIKSYSRLHPAWCSFIKHCESLGSGEIEKLKIQDGLPVMAEEVTNKMKFTE